MFFQDLTLVMLQLELVVLLLDLPKQIISCFLGKSGPFFHHGLVFTLELAVLLLGFNPPGFEVLVSGPDFVPGPFSYLFVSGHFLCLFLLLKLVKVLAILGVLILNLV